MEQEPVEHRLQVRHGAGVQLHWEVQSRHNTTMEVREAGVADAARVAEIQVLSWQAAYAGLMPQEHLDGLDPARSRPGWERTMAEVDAARGAMLVVSAGGGADDPVGFAYIRESRDEDAVSSAVGEVWAIYLLSAAWGKGLGRALMGAALSRLTELGYVQATLWVMESNTRARRFYEAAGFRPDGAVKEDDRLGFTLREVRYRRSLPVLAQAPPADHGTGRPAGGPSAI